MITIKTLHEMYYGYIDEKIKTLEKNIEETKESLIPIVEQLRKHKLLIVRTVDYTNLLNGNVAKLGEDTETLEYKYVNIQIGLYYTTHKILSELSLEISRLKQHKIAYPIYRSIIEMYNSRLLEMVIRTGKRIHLRGFGDFAVSVVNNNKKRINWGESNKKKKKLEKQGIKTYNKNEALAAAKENKAYEAVAWFVYHPKIDLWFKMNFNERYKKAYPILRNYVFKPTRGNGSATQMLMDFKREIGEEGIKNYRPNVI